MPRVVLEVFEPKSGPRAGAVFITAYVDGKVYAPGDDQNLVRGTDRYRAIADALRLIDKAFPKAHIELTGPSKNTKVT
jgi:hypothetical protein